MYWKSHSKGMGRPAMPAEQQVTEQSKSEITMGQMSKVQTIKNMIRV